MSNQPEHIAIIMDGNGRWAASKGLPREEGHRAGAEAVRRVVTRARELKIKYLTLYAFSAQNWERPRLEVAQLMGLLKRFCDKERDLLLDKAIRFRVLGDRSKLPEATRDAVELLESATQNNAEMQLLLAVSYGGREEITQAARRIAQQVEQGELRADQVDQSAVQRCLWSHDVPDPDLILRTSGEFRVSNFLLWQMAYAEFVVDDRFWPDMDAAGLDEAIAKYRQRDRRFGALGGS